MFKNLTMYRFNPTTESNPQLIGAILINRKADELISDFPPIDPTNQEFMRRGWLPLDRLLIEMVTEARFLPLTMIIRQRAIDNGAVDLAVRRKIAQIQTAESRIVGKKEKTQIKDEILFEMIPKAPVKEKRINGYVCATGEILIDAVGKAAEDYISFLRESVGSLACRKFDLDEDGKPVTERQIHHYVMKSLDNEHFDFHDEAEKYRFKFTNTFAFINGKEQIAVRDCESATLNGEFYTRVQNGQVAWCNFDDPHVSFRLMVDMSLKALTFVDMEFEHTNDQEATVAAHRMQIQAYTKLIESIVAEINMANEGHDDE